MLCGSPLTISCTSSPAGGAIVGGVIVVVVIGGGGVLIGRHVHPLQNRRQAIRLLDQRRLPQRFELLC
jgi:hypothetical protein